MPKHPDGDLCVEVKPGTPEENTHETVSGGADEAMELDLVMVRQ